MNLCPLLILWSKTGELSLSVKATQVAWKKNIFLGLKRGRFFSGPFNALLQMGITVLCLHDHDC